jgi:hypothetical protein
MSKSLALAVVTLFVLLGFAVSQQTLEKVPTVDFTRETELDDKGLKQFKAYDVACEPCKGEGTTVCEGCKDREPPLPNCTECTGKKRATCRTCAGKKKLHDPLLQLTCTFCKGSGWYDCALCGGRGIISEKGADGTTAEKPCGGCKKVGRFVCTPCGGERVLDTIRIRKKPALEASLAELRETRTELEAAMQELEPFEPLERASKTEKALAAMLTKPSKLVPALKDMQVLLEEVQDGLSRAGAGYTNFLENQRMEYLTFRNRAVHLLRHDIRVLDLCIERAEFNENVAKTKK